MYHSRSLTVEQLLGRRLNDVEAKYALKELYVSGPLEVPLPGPRVSVVGTRMPSESGLRAAAEIVEKLVRGKALIVSGLAKGIDTAAHRRALELGGFTVAVIGTPLDRFYPPENRDLQERLMREQLVVSQFPQGHHTAPRDFIMRNRTMALISDATVIVEAGERSGAESQGWEAIRLGRPLYLSDFLFEKGVTWAKKMLDYGAVRLEDPEKILDELPSPLKEPLPI